MKRALTVILVVLLAVACGGRRGRGADGGQADSLATETPEAPSADAGAKNQRTAKADTIYITREVPVAQRPDTVVRYVERPRRASRQVASRQTEPPATGRSVAEDNIDYSMLVMR